MKILKEKRNLIGAILLMAMFTFTFLGLEYLFVDKISLLVLEDKAVLAQNYVLGMSCFGFFLYPFYNRYCKDKARGIVSLISALIIVLLIYFIYLHINYLFTMISGLILFFLLGMIGSATFYKALCLIEKRQYLARCVGMAYMMGIVLQFINNNFVYSTFIESIILSLFSCLLLAMIVRIPPISIQNDIPVSETLKIRKHCGFLLVVLIFVMSCVFSTLDNAVTLVHASGIYNIGQLPRVLLALSGLLAGIIFDMNERKYMSLIMYCIMMISTLCIAIIKLSEPFLLGLIVFYITAGFFAVYFTSCFMELACYMKYSDLWAGLGRAVNNLAAMIFTKISLSLLNSEFSLFMIISMIFVFVSVAIIAFVYSNKRNDLINQIKEKQIKVLSKEQRLSKIKEEYNFTQREIEVFDYLISTENTVQEIAEKMYISKRTIERYISSIYKKTNVQSRVSLLNLYNNQNALL